MNWLERILVRSSEWWDDKVNTRMKVYKTTEEKYSHMNWMRKRGWFTMSESVYEWGSIVHYER